MIESVQDYLKLLSKYKITPNQYLFLVLVGTNDYASLYQYSTQVKKFSKSEIEDLQKRNFIVYEGNIEETIRVDMFTLSPKYEKIFRFSQDLGEEFWEKYPTFFFIDGRKIPAKSCNKEALLDKYNSYVKGNPEKHEKIIKALDYAIKSDLVNMGIEKWFTSEFWKDLEKEMQKSNGITRETYGTKIY